MKQIKSIVIVGAGNIGTYFACVCANKGYDTSIYCSKPELINNVLNVVGEDVIVANNIKASNNMEVFVDADMVFVTYPAFMLEDFSKKIEPYIKEGIYIGVIPGSGAAEFAFKNLIDKGAILFGIQRVPAIARLKEYGKTVCIEGKKKELYLASIPLKYCDDLSYFMERLFDIKCISLPNYLSVTLTPSNPILHTTRLCSLFNDYCEGKVYKRNPLFYGEWSNESSDLLIKCDNELQNIIKKLDKMDLSYVKPLKVHYESNTIEELTNKLCSISSLHNIYSPMKKVDSGYIPDLDSRYFTADFPYGLAIIKSFGEIVNVDTPYIDMTLKWYEEVSRKCCSFKLEKYDINNIGDIYKYYGK